MTVIEILKTIEEVNSLFKDGKITLLRREQRIAALKRLLMKREVNFKD